MTCGPYTATNVDPGPSTPCLTSTLTVRVNTGMTSSLIMVGTRSLAGQNTIVNTTLIMVIGKNVTVLWLFQVVGSCLLRHDAYCYYILITYKPEKNSSINTF